MKNHTVLLLLPESIASDFGREVYHWVGLAARPTEAIELARNAFAHPSGRAADEPVCRPTDLHVLLAGEGVLENVTWEETLTES